MRIKRLDLEAFGPFTETQIDFSGNKPGLHIIYGPNEAGKSSTLRALRAWLYGFPERTQDNFVHPNEQLRVSGVLEDEQGQELFFVRRKKRKASVLDKLGNPMDPAQIRSMLQGIDQDVFEKLFGLDHNTLVQGGTAILQEKGSVGTTLFSAGSGISYLQKVLDDLKAESAEIFKPQAAKPALNSALRSFQQLKTEINKISLSSHKWKEHDRAFRRAQDKLQKEQDRRSKLSREYRHLERIQQALKPLGLRRKLLERYEQLKDVPDLPGDFSKRRSENLEKLRQADQSLVSAQNRLRDFRNKADGIKLNNQLLDQTETIKDLYQRLGEYRKGRHDQPVLEGKRVQEKTAAGNILRKIRPDLSLDQVQGLRPLLRRRRSINEFGGKLPLLEKEVKTVKKRVDKLKKDRQEIASILANLPEACDLQPLKQAIDQAAGLGDIDADLEQGLADLANNQAAFSTGLKQIGLWEGSATELLGLTLPLEETVHRFAEVWRQMEEKGRSLDQKEESLNQEFKRLNRDILALEKGGEVPTEEELLEQRAQRDRGWSLLRRKWLEGLDVSQETKEYHPDLSLPEAYEQYVLLADKTADRLRREGERVHKYAQLQADLEKVKQELAELERERVSLDQKLADQEQLWQQAWQESGIQPLRPPEMTTWMAKIGQLRFQAQQIVDQQKRIEFQSEQRLKALNHLSQALTSLEAEVPESQQLAPVLRSAKTFLDQAEEKDNQRQNLEKQIDKLDKDIAQAQPELKEAQEALDDWHRQWKEILNELGLSKFELPSGVAEFFEELEGCLNHLDRSEEFQKRIQGLERDAKKFKDDVSSLIDRVATELSGLPVDQAVDRLNGLLARAREDEATLKTYQDNIQAAEQEILQAKSDKQAAEEELERLCKLAGCEHHDYLESTEQLWREKVQLEERIKEEEEGLAQIAGGLSLAELESEVSQIDPDALPGRLRECSQELEQVEQRINELAEVVGEERRELEHMDGSDLAAQKAEQAEEKLSEIRRLSEHYTRLRIAAKVLEEEIERYRAENQDPVLRLAGDYFAELTLNSFEGLRTDLDDKGGQVIVGLRNGGDRVSVEGMSSGTRDQLFFALRLASLEYRLEKSQAMPFIVDDVLINFDDQRSKAALRALARLAKKNQVLVFSHHRQVAEIAETLGLGLVHEL